MDSIDLSKWTGKLPPSGDAGPVPSPFTKASGNGQDTEGGSEYGTAHSIPGSSDQSRRNSSFSAVSGLDPGLDQTRHSTRERSLPFHPAKTPRISVNVPGLSREGSFERLPGYHSVKQILQESSPDKFMVKLESGEVELVSHLFSLSKFTFTRLSTD